MRLYDDINGDSWNGGRIYTDKQKYYQNIFCYSMILGIIICIGLISVRLL